MDGSLRSSLTSGTDVGVRDASVMAEDLSMDSVVKNLPDEHPDLVWQFKFPDSAPVDVGLWSRWKEHTNSRLYRETAIVCLFPVYNILPAIKR